ncbi:hypothetical protein [Nocardia gipuzkoensis]
MNIYPQYHAEALPAFLHFNMAEVVSGPDVAGIGQPKSCTMSPLLSFDRRPTVVIHGVGPIPANR